jgi:hypothetical protein
MYKWYTKQHKIHDEMTDEVKAIIYESKRPKASKKQSAKLEPFIKKNIIWTGLSPLQDDSLFPNKLYLVYDDNSNNKENLYFVFPKEKRFTETTNFWAADHFTFLMDVSDKRKPCHFHTTRYLYDSGLFLTVHVKDFMPDKLFLPDNISDIFKKHQNEKNFLIELISFPWKQLRQGGSKKQNKPQEKARYINNNEAFCNKWQEELVKKAVIFGIKRGDKMCWTATIYKQGRVREAYGYTAMYYETSILNQETDYEIEFQLRFLEDFVSNI